VATLHIPDLADYRMKLLPLDVCFSCRNVQITVRNVQITVRKVKLNRTVRSMNTTILMFLPLTFKNRVSYI